MIGGGMRLALKLGRAGYEAHLKLAVAAARRVGGAVVTLPEWEALSKADQEEWAAAADAIVAAALAETTEEDEDNLALRPSR
jgi:hypothetical protein